MTDVLESRTLYTAEARFRAATVGGPHPPTNPSPPATTKG